MSHVSQVPDRKLQFVKKSNRAEVIQPAEDVVSTAPHLLMREAVIAEAAIIVLSTISLAFDAPLEEIANPFHTPNPAKAPWYFLGLQELLHYFPPVVAGVLIPALVVAALVIIPYFEVNIRPRGIRGLSRARVTGWATALAVITVAGLLPFKCWPLASVTVFTYLGVLWGLWGKGARAERLGHLTVPDWIIIWFVAATVMLTVIGTFFRGPSWTWVWPWKTGARI